MWARWCLGLWCREVMGAGGGRGKGAMVSGAMVSRGGGVGRRKGGGSYGVWGYGKNKNYSAVTLNLLPNYFYFSPALFTHSRLASRVVKRGKGFLDFPKFG